MSARDLPLGFFFQTPPGGAVGEFRVAPPRDSDVFCVRGLWLCNDPYEVTLREIYVDPKRPLIPAPCDASSFNAAPRQDGYPRFVALPAGEITVKCPLVLRAMTWGTPALCPQLVGHAVGKWIRGAPAGGHDGEH